MEESKFLLFLNSIDWVFAAVLLMGGRYLSWYNIGGLKSRRTKFLVLSFFAGALYLLFRWLDGHDFLGQFTNFFITFLFVNTFYGIAGRKLFELIESKFKWMVPASARDGEDDDEDGPGSNPTNPPPPPPGP